MYPHWRSSAKEITPAVEWIRCSLLWPYILLSLCCHFYFQSLRWHECFCQTEEAACVNLKQGIALHLIRKLRQKTWVGVVFPECNHLSALNLPSVLAWQVIVLVKPDEGILELSFFYSKTQKMSKKHLAAAQKWIVYTPCCTIKKNKNCQKNK